MVVLFVLFKSSEISDKSVIIEKRNPKITNPPACLYNFADFNSLQNQSI